MPNLQDKQHRRVVWLSIAVLAISLFTLANMFDALFKAGGADVQQVILIATTSMILVSSMVLYAMMRSSRDLREVRRLAFVDELTGLSNRRRFNEQLELELNRCNKTNRSFALILFDLDRFKAVNDCHGHKAGDAVIRQFGERISKSLRGQDFVARLSGDEFAAIITDVASPLEVEGICERIKDEMKSAFSFKDRQIYTGVSMGAAILGDADKNAEEVFRMADFALYRSKETGRGKLQIFDPEMADKIKQRSMLEFKLREAIATEAFSLRYLPLMSQQGEIVGVEALLRWEHADKGMISPNEFIPLAEEAGLITPLGESVLRTGCQDIGPLQNIRLAVNVSPIQFLQDGFVEQVATILQETGFESQRLELEVTESLLMQDADRAKRVMERLRTMGVRIALDDFGTGYSSMSYLREFPLDRIKIDRTLTDEIKFGDDNDEFVEKMIDFGNTLGMSVTVEGVETQEQLKTLQTSACSELQGFLFSRPLTKNELEASKLISDLSKEDNAVAAPFSALMSAQDQRLAG